VVNTALGALRLRGRCGLVGTPRGPLELSPTAVSLGRSVHGILQGDAVPHDFIPRLIELWRQGRLPFERLVTEYALEDINEAERAMRSGEVIKPVLRAAPDPGDDVLRGRAPHRHARPGDVTCGLKGQAP
jgi:aryl-alcohol dehydrogenase